MEPKAYRCDLLYRDQIINLETSVLGSSPKDWQLDQCSIDREASTVLRLTKPVEGLTFQFLIEQSTAASEARKDHALEVLGPSPESGESLVTVTRVRSPWTSSLVSKLQSMISDHKDSVS